MKKIICYLLICQLALYLSGCSDWLKVSPKMEVRQDEMFETAVGFKDALTGVYIKLKSTNLYGKSMTMTTLEHMAQHWKSASGSTEEALAKFDYEHNGVESTMENIWREMYNTITHINNILENIDAKESVFEPEMFRLVKGEALALRAFCHFDLLRLWGPVPTEAASVEGKIFPYVTTVSKQAHPFHSYDEIIGFIDADLMLAADLLEPVDPIFEWDNENLNNLKVGVSQEFKPEDPFWYHRQVRMNFYAIKGVQARFYLWTGKKQEAYAAAKRVYEAKNKTGKPQFCLGSAADISVGNKVLTVEHLWGLSVELEKTFKAIFEGVDALEKEETAIKKDVFESETSDIRVGFWKEITTSTQQKKYVCTKYQQPEVEKSPFAEVVSLLRLSEIYLILAECAPADEAVIYINELRLFRNLGQAVVTEENKQELIIKEYRKEFYVEGVMFFLYKRLGIRNLLWKSSEIDLKSYVVPLPINA